MSVESPIIVPDQPGTADNRVQPFAIEGMNVRGRAARLGTVADRTIRAHDYPGPVAEIVGQSIALVALLGSMLKDDGVITLQTKSDGPVSMLVADFRTPGIVRGYAKLSREEPPDPEAAPTFTDLVGRGYLALTVDPGKEKERYQGVVELEGASLADCAVKYFRQSEQIPTALKLSAAPDRVSGHWRAGGIMVQNLANDDTTGEADDTAASQRGAEVDDDWNRAAILMESTRSEELLDPQLDLHRLLFRLFHEDGVRVYDPLNVRYGCRCSRQRIAHVLNRFSKDELADMIVDGKIQVTCEFCNETYDFDARDWSA